MKKSDDPEVRTRFDTLRQRAKGASRYLVLVYPFPRLPVDLVLRLALPPV